MKYTIFLFALLLMNINSTAQAFGEIHGKVVDAAGKPIESAQVITMVGSSVVGATTDSLGKFKLKPLSSGIYNLEFRMVGMEKLEYTGVQVNPDKITRLPVVTLHEIGELTTLEIIEYTIPLIQVDGGNVTQIQAKELQQMSVSHGGNLKSIAASLTSDIKKSANGEELYFRGSRSGAVIYMIDGVKIRENVPNIPSSGISRMMVYTGGVPAKYGDTTGGVIVIETKSYLELYNEKMASQGN